MRVLVATRKGQGQRSSDFCFCSDQELLRHGLICAKDANDPDPDGGCGCGRSLTGMVTAKGTTTFLVAERTMTKTEFINDYLGSCQDSGWLSDSPKVRMLLGVGQDTAKARFIIDACELLAVAGMHPVGTVLELRKGEFYERTDTPALPNPAT